MCPSRRFLAGTTSIGALADRQLGGSNDPISAVGASLRISDAVVRLGSLGLLGS